ncbi:ferredoxin [Streptomyces atroolivaceus]|uniref:ferredoxin n=1 Tax=Streptomyces atroolivaceus TaxID=66869 RepID=UPI0020247C73|nr:ferredoxin [Streptomyces atroolivaceus]
MSATSRPVGSERVRAEIHLCVGAGQCVLAAPAVFDQAVDDGLVLVLDDTPPDSELSAVRDAVWACPSGALTLREGPVI